MSWNYRVLRHKNEPFTELEPYRFEFHEVYYDDDGHPNGFTINPVGPYGSSPEEVVESLRGMVGALAKPILDGDGEELVEIEGLTLEGFTISDVKQSGFSDVD